MRVIDGTHRVLAAVLRGQHTIPARFVECDDEQAFVFAVEANIAHGLPLSRQDRTAAVRRIIATHPQWSDRAIAAFTGLAHKTVGAIRRRSSGEGPQSHTRRGRDGRLRPVDGAHRHREAGRLLAVRPDASLREVAAEAGVCASTVRDARDRLRRGEDPVLPTQRGASRGTGRTAAVAATPLNRPADHGHHVALLRTLRGDPSLRLSESGRTLLHLLRVCTVDEAGWDRLRDNVPAHCADLVVRAARECGQAWQEFAVEVERRANRRRSG
ncbi:cell cycle transcriptional regulator TrcR [Amycolatopsis arida]|nr:cell cycle transcriptional regulator TrcR [Amycolatopsis arida]